MKSKKVLHVVAGMDPKMGGVSKAVQMVVTGLNQLGVPSEVISLDESGSVYLSDFCFPVHAIGVGKTTWRYNGKLFAWLIKNCQQFEVIIIHGLWLYPSFAVRKAISSLKKKNMSTPTFFVMPHGMLDPYFQSTAGRRLKAIRNWIFWKAIERKVIEEADGLLFTCEMEKILAKKTFTPYRPQHELVVGLGVEAPPLIEDVMTEAFKSSSLLANSRSYLLFIGRIHEKKGVDILIKAYLNLKKSNQDIPLLVIAGPGIETEYGLEIKRLASKTSDIVFTGMLSGNLKWGAFYGCEAFVLPSHQENFGIAIVEAMACSKPVLISNQINIWKEILEAGAGLVAEDTLSKTEEMLKTWISYSERQKQSMGKSARSCYNKNFAISAASQHLKTAIIKEDDLVIR